MKTRKQISLQSGQIDSTVHGTPCVVATAAAFNLNGVEYGIFAADAATVTYIVDLVCAASNSTNNADPKSYETVVIIQASDCALVGEEL